ELMLAGGMGMGIAWSMDDGDTWHHLDETNGINRYARVQYMASRGDLVIAVGDAGYDNDMPAVQVSGDGGKTWRGADEGAEHIYWGYVFFDKDHAYLSTSFHHNFFYYRPLSELFPQMDAPTEKNHTAVELSLNVSQNPAGNRTTISFGLPTPGYLDLKLFDARGSEVRTLVKGEREAGHHDLLLDAGGLPAGMYYCRLVAGGSAVTRPVLVTR
ncbi:MAG TPA: T9SS type A sorting domain-containing protein, partial [Anseongella sp.]|nr:T9SS type A sorting domain-containing protein [Anseongella sp.]